MSSEKKKSPKPLHLEKSSIHRELLLVAVLCIALGLFMVIDPGASGELLCRIIGVGMVIWGVLRAIIYFVQSRAVVLGSFSLVQGALLIGFGITFLARPELLAAFLVLGLGVLLAVGAVLKLQYALELHHLRASSWWVELLGTLLMAILAVVSFVNPFKAGNALMIFLGIAFLLDGVWDLISVIALMVLSRRVAKAVEELEPEPPRPPYDPEFHDDVMD
ncbi:MAG: DUF308 domain-containing protein [Oscillospiraceae bacterium]|nr:DUF308 domain-containing protein [Oscillospiraceae bacterium]